jgi:murein DD-endopeptidase MepM/ murein hydrolase activator NlpD
VGIERGAVHTRARAALHLLIVFVALVALTGPMLSGTATATASPAAASITYPSWADVKKARASEAKTKKAITQIKALLAQLEQNLQAARADEVAKGDAFEEAQNAYDDQVMVADGLRAQADTAGEEADVAKKQANRLLVMLAKTGNGDVVANLLVDAGGADALLYRLEAMDRLSDQSSRIYSEALKLQNSAQSLADQADVAEKKRDELKDVAEDALAAARAATAAADAALLEQQDHQVELQAQLTVLVEKREATEADYRAGVIAREKARKERERLERERLEREGQNGGVNSAGWARPSAGYISSGYGMRYHPIYHYWRLHNGTDIAGQGCGASIRAVHSGYVMYAGWNGTLGNYVQINHQDGTSSGYGHIIGGGIQVRYGQWVNAGTVIARVGSTGASTGCHLHFMIRVNGQLTNPVPFMRNRGISLG